MQPVPFPDFVEGEGLRFGLSDPLLLLILDSSLRGQDADALMDAAALQAAQLSAEHLLTLRRLARRYERLRRAAEGLKGEDLDFPLRGPAELAVLHLLGMKAGRGVEWARACLGLARETLQRGTIHFHAKRLEDGRSEELEDLLGQSLACDELPAHRWFKARRAADQDLLYLEVRPPALERERLERQGWAQGAQDDLWRSVDKPVLDVLSARA